MAEGVRRITGSDLAISVTGVAGPDPDDRGNPVGLVYLGLTDGPHTWVRANRSGGSRGRIRTMSAHAAFDLVRRFLEKKA
jgi:nicotinamide-nucleotide amidase